MLPADHYRLRHGRDLDPGEPSSKVFVTYTDGSRDWDQKSYTHQSTPGLVLSLLSKVKSQGVWPVETAWAQFSDPANVGARWLTEQEDPWAAFELMWAKAYDTGPRLSFQQLVSMLVQMVEERPGLQLVYLREAAVRSGWRNRGDLDGLLAGLVGSGLLREERVMGPSGVRVTARRFWKATSQAVAQVARAATVTLSLGLLAVTNTDPAIGQKNPVTDRSFLRLLTDKKLRARGLKLLRQRLCGRRPWAAWRPAAFRRPQQPRHPSSAELAMIRAELDNMHLELDRRPVPMGSAGGIHLSCLL